MSLGAIAMVLLSTMRYGIGMTSDTASYFSAARSLLAGKGYLGFDNRIYAQWPPLFPTLLAGFNLFGLEPATGARVLNSFAFGVIVFVSGLFFFRSTMSRPFAIMGAFSVAFAAPLLGVSVMAWSEPVFIMLLVLFLLALAYFLQAPRLSRLLLVSSLAALACLQRYAGVTLIMAGAILILVASSKTSIWRRLQYLLIFGLTSALPLGLWLWRNTMGGATVGGHAFGRPTIPQLIRSSSIGLEILAPWFFTERVPNPAKIIAIGSILFLAMALALVTCLKNWDHRQLRITHIITAMIFGIVYFGFLATAAAGLRWDLEPRLMAPLYIPVMILVVTGIEAGIRLAQEATGGRKSLPIVGATLFGLWLLYPLTESKQDIFRFRRVGTDGYSSALWKDSAMMDWLRHHPLDGAIYSNTPDAVFLLTGQIAEITPHHYWSPADRAAWMAHTETPQEYVVWSHYSCWNYLYDLRELLSRYRTEEIASFEDGKIYRLLGESDGPPAFGLFRLWSAVKNKHVYAISRAERDQLLADRSQKWVNEGPVFYVYHTPEPNTVGVHRLRSASRDTQLLVADPGKREKLLTNGTDWTDDGTVFFVATKPTEEDLVPVYDLWSDSLDDYFYTARQKEIGLLTTGGGSDIWTVGGIVWYAYGPPQ